MQTSSSSFRSSRRSLAVLASLTMLFLPLQAADLDIAIQCSPSTIILDAAALGGPDQLTVHTDLPFSWVDRTSVALSGLRPTATFADSCGNLVARFKLSDVQPLLAPPSTTLTLTGLTDEAWSFAGSDVVQVVAKTPRR